MTFNPIHFIPSKHESQILSYPITRILAIPHAKQHISTNHWCFYLLTPTPHTSIALDCQPTHSIPATVLVHGGSKANLIFSEVPYATPPDAQAVFALDVAKGVTVQDVYNLLTRNGRHRYEFDEDGVGCRWWVSEQLDLLYGQGFVTDAAQVIAAKEAILLLWPERSPLVIDKGAYYE